MQVAPQSTLPKGGRPTQQVILIARFSVGDLLYYYSLLWASPMMLHIKPVGLHRINATPCYERTGLRLRNWSSKVWFLLHLEPLSKLAYRSNYVRITKVPDAAIGLNFLGVYDPGEYYHIVTCLFFRHNVAAICAGEGCDCCSTPTRRTMSDMLWGELTAIVQTVRLSWKIILLLLNRLSLIRLVIVMTSWKRLYIGLVNMMRYHGDGMVSGIQAYVCGPNYTDL